MENKNHDHQLHIFFFPFMAQGHIIPTTEMAKLFASRGCKSTIITTAYHANLLSKTIQNSSQMINVLTFKFPSSENELPEGCESLHMAASPDLVQKFCKATTMLGPQLDLLLKRHRPDCLVADMLFTWSSDVAGRYGIPRLIFHGTCYFSLCASLCVHRYAPHKNVSSDSDPFLLPNLPGDFEFTRNQLAYYERNHEETEVGKVYNASKEIEGRSYGVLVNSFYELEPVYADHYRKVLGVKARHIGPLFLHNKLLAEDNANKGIKMEHECLKWLNSKKPSSVVYVCFGSLSDFNDAQLMEIALGLEASEQEFIWVVKKEKKQGIREKWLPEGVCAGVPMVTWPVSAEQFYNEKLVTKILGIGFGVGAQKWTRLVGDFVKREAIEKALSRVMLGEEAEEMRSKAKALKEMARRAVMEGGSSYLELDSFIEELEVHRMARVDDSSS
ncbi:hypothetical protein FNV43_RR22532 [Rhamnella rubrinervis]|uniref:Uncharacterized protein n=1 Tax=Rhamnella rubrinervis TaxID=2594499 RepID=A0A8K0DUH9_9ROSA|nr:hypothetical protein FNV43_RR22532 [Rhamnella rubrinervis]